MPEIHIARTEFCIIPAGTFRAKDGRPKGLPGWKIDATIAQRVIAASVPPAGLVIDYENQTIHAARNGQPAPAAGRFNSFVWREGVGLFVVGVSWTDRAARYIEALEYRYIDPYFTYDELTGEVTRIGSVGLTNNPVIYYQPGIAALSAMPRATQAAMCQQDMQAPDRLSLPESMIKNDAAGAEYLRQIFPGIFDN